MSDEIYLIDRNDTPLALRASAYDSEALLQGLLADHPDILAGAQIDPAVPRRWLLIDREVGLAAAEDTGARWSVDNLFLDQDAVPTLVEVKRSGDTRIRREVIGQILEYAANAVVHWPISEIRNRYDARCARLKRDGDAHLVETLDPEDDPDSFWVRVEDNLKAGRVRLLIVADAVPVELRRIVEFLNQQMDPAEVLALEVTQYVADGLRALVPRVVGHAPKRSRRAGVSRSRGRRQWDEDLWFANLAEHASAAAVDAARRIHAWAVARSPSVTIRWGTGARDGSFGCYVSNGVSEQSLIGVYSLYGQVEIRLQELKKAPPFSDRARREELLSRLNAIDAVHLSAERIDMRPSLPLDLLADESRLRRVLDVLDWAVDAIQATGEARADDPSTPHNMNER